MITLIDDIENLDKMVEGGSPKDAIRSQIRLIAREAAALQADYASLAENHAKLNQTLANYKARDDAESADAMRRSQAVYLDKPCQPE
jgi:hypothetical protein